MKVRDIPAGWIGLVVILGAWSFAATSCALGNFANAMKCGASPESNICQPKSEDK